MDNCLDQLVGTGCSFIIDWCQQQPEWSVESFGVPDKNESSGNDLREVIGAFLTEEPLPLPACIDLLLEWGRAHDSRWFMVDYNREYKGGQWIVSLHGNGTLPKGKSASGRDLFEIIQDILSQAKLPNGIGVYRYYNP